MAGNLERAELANHRLLRDVSHELRSPLARLRVALELARTRDQGVVAAELERIELESERLEALVDEVLDLLRQSSSAQPLQREKFNLQELLEDVLAVVAYEVPEGAPAIEHQLGLELPVLGNRELLWRLFENLLRNALIHTAPGTAVLLVARVAPDQEQLLLTVADRGPGLPEKELDKVFDAFYRVDDARDRASGGHGLGLAIAAAAARRHQGTIVAANRPGGGLRVEVTLPRAR
jgi:two-component system sensor histidine kinase CpxA